MVLGSIKTLLGVLLLILNRKRWKSIWQFRCITRQTYFHAIIRVRYWARNYEVIWGKSITDKNIFTGGSNNLYRLNGNFTITVDSKNSVVESERDPYYQNLQAKLNAAQSAQESPEIIALTEQLDADPENKELKAQLAALLAEAGKKEQALELLLSVLRKDLNFGTAKKDFLDLIASLPDGDALAGTYRRKLYSLLSSWVLYK